MEYACVVWDPYTHKSVKALEQVQAFVCKMVSHQSDAGYEELLELLNIPSLLIKLYIPRGYKIDCATEWYMYIYNISYLFMCQYKIAISN